MTTSSRHNLDPELTDIAEGRAREPGVDVLGHRRVGEYSRQYASGQARDSVRREDSERVIYLHPRQELVGRQPWDCASR